MSDLVVTVPLSFGLDRWIAEGDPAGSRWTGAFWDFSVGGGRPDIEPGERVYVVYNRRIRGYAPLVSLHRSGTRWLLVRAGDARAVTIHDEVIGFRGWRRRWWDRLIEHPFPDWQIP